MPTVSVDSRNLSRVLQDHFASKQALLRKVAADTAQRGWAEALNITDTEEIVASQLYRDGFKVVPQPQGAALVNDAPHALIVEWGRRPGARWPPVDAIRAWVELKLGKTGREADAAAFLIGRKIHERGTPPKHVMRRVYQQMRLWYREEVEARLRAGG